MVINLVKHFPIMKDEVKDNLTSTDTNLPLSANQGKVLDGKKVNIAQGIEKKGMYLKVGADGNVSPSPMEQKPVYTVRYFRNKSAASGPGVLELYNNTDEDLSTYESRLSIIQKYCRHCLVAQGITSIKYLDETNFEKDIDGNSVDIVSGAEGDAVLEIDTIYGSLTRILLM